MIYECLCFCVCYYNFLNHAGVGLFPVIVDPHLQQISTVIMASPFRRLTDSSFGYIIILDIIIIISFNASSTGRTFEQIKNRI